MSGAESGVATQIGADEPRAVFLHCYGHSFNLTMCDTIKLSKETRDAMCVILHSMDSSRQELQVCWK